MFVLHFTVVRSTILIPMKWHFKIAASFGCRQGALDANPALLEPMMKVEITTPEEWMGDVVGDVSRRRGMIEGMDDGHAGLKIIRA